PRAPARAAPRRGADGGDRAAGHAPRRVGGGAPPAGRGDAAARAAALPRLARRAPRAEAVALGPGPDDPPPPRAAARPRAPLRPRHRDGVRDRAAGAV